MANINADGFINDATDKYNTLVDNLMSRGLDNLSPDEFANAVDSSGLKEVFGKEQADNVELHFDDSHDFDNGQQPLVITLGDIPEEYAGNSEDFATDDGSARITIMDDRLDNIRSEVNNGAMEDFISVIDDLKNDNVTITHISDYELRNYDIDSGKYVDNTHIEYMYVLNSNVEDLQEDWQEDLQPDSTIQLVVNPNTDEITSKIPQVDSFCNVFQEDKQISSDYIDVSEILDRYYDFTFTDFEEIERSFHVAADADSTQVNMFEINGVFFLETYDDYQSESLPEFAELYENCRYAVTIAILKNMTFDDTNDFIDSVHNVSKYLDIRSDYVEEHPDAIAQLDHDIIEYYGDVNPDNIENLIDQYENGDEPDYRKLDLIGVELKSGLSSLVDRSINDFKDKIDEIEGSDRGDGADAGSSSDVEDIQHGSDGDSDGAANDSAVDAENDDSDFVEDDAERFEDLWSSDDSVD